MNKVKIINNIPQIVTVPKFYTLGTTTYVGDFDKQSNEIHKQAGYYPLVQPEFNFDTQKRGDELIFDVDGEFYTYEVIDKTQTELEEEAINRLDALDREWDAQAAKRLLRKIAEPILQDEENLTEQDIEDAKMLYKEWRVGAIYDKDSTNIDEKRFTYNGDLYKVIGAKHTSQSDWTPDTAVSLYSKTTPPGIISVFSPRTPENAYMIGDKVYYPTENDNIYESLIDNNVWSPTEYPAGWKIKN